MSENKAVTVQNIIITPAFAHIFIDGLASGDHVYTRPFDFDEANIKNVKANLQPQFQFEDLDGVVRDVDSDRQTWAFSLSDLHAALLRTGTQTAKVRWSIRYSSAATGHVNVISYTGRSPFGHFVAAREAFYSDFPNWSKFRFYVSEHKNRLMLKQTFGSSCVR